MKALQWAQALERCRLPPFGGRCSFDKLDRFDLIIEYAAAGVFNYVPPLGANLRPAGLGLFVDLIRPARVDGYLTPDFQVTSALAY